MFEVSRESTTPLAAMPSAGEDVPERDLFLGDPTLLPCREPDRLPSEDDLSNTLWTFIGEVRSLGLLLGLGDEDTLELHLIWDVVGDLLGKMSDVCTDSGVTARKTLEPWKYTFKIYYIYQ